MIARLIVTIILLLLAFGAFWANALGAGYLTNPFGILFVFFAAVAWFKWESIRDGFDAAKGESQLPIIRLASKIIGGMQFRRQPTRRSSSN
jgi:uncharacterized membrane protein YbhN (UPF0104 family)